MSPWCRTHATVAPDRRRRDRRVVAVRCADVDDDHAADGLYQLFDRRRGAPARRSRGASAGYASMPSASSSGTGARRTDRATPVTEPVADPTADPFEGYSRSWSSCRLQRRDPLRALRASKRGEAARTGGLVRRIETVCDTLCARHEGSDPRRRSRHAAAPDHPHQRQAARAGGQQADPVLRPRAHGRGRHPRVRHRRRRHRERDHGRRRRRLALGRRRSPTSRRTRRSGWPTAC